MITGGHTTTLAQRLLFIGILILVFGWWFYLQVSGETESVANYLFNVVYAVPLLAASAYAYVRAWQWSRDRSPDIAAMVFLGTSFLFYGLAQCAWAYANIALGDASPDFSVADLFYLSSVVFQIVALVIFVGHVSSAKPHKRSSVVLFFAGIALFSCVLAWALWRLVFPSIDDTFSTDSLYAVLSNATILLTMLNIYRGWHAHLRSFLLSLLVAFTFLGIADAMFALRNSTGDYFNGDVSDGLYALGALAILFAVLRHAPVRVETEDVPQSASALLRREILIPGAIMLIVIAFSFRYTVSSYQDSRDELTEKLEAQAYDISGAIDGAVDLEWSFLSSFRAFMESGEQVTDGEFLDFDRTISAQDSSSLFTYVSKDRVILQYSLMEEDQGKYRGYDLRNDHVRMGLLDAAERQTGIVATEPVMLSYADAPGSMFATPVLRGGALDGFVIGEAPLADMLQPAQGIMQNHPALLNIQAGGRRVTLAGDELLDAAASPFPDSRFPASESVFRIAQIPWHVQVSPVPDDTHALYVEALIRLGSVNLFGLLLVLLLYSIFSQQSILKTQLNDRTVSLRASVKELSQYKFFLDSVNDGVVVTSRRRVLYHNQALADLFGVPHSLSDWDISAFLTDQTQASDIEEGLAKDGTWDGELRVRTHAGAERDLQASVRPAHDEDGKLVGYMTVTHDVTDRKSIERDKTQFVSLVAHQLRAPMTQMRWLVETMEEAKRLPPRLRADLETLHAIVLKENQFVGDLLNVSRIERGVLKLNLENVGVEELLKEVIEPLKPLLKERKMRLEVEDLPRTARLHVDREKAVQALRNILDNALRYSPPGSQVTLDAVRNKGMWELRVTDQGAGIPDELQPRLFDIKTSISTSLNQNASSTGLGLYLTKKFVEGMGGTVKFETSSKGTTFFVRLPSASKEAGLS